MRIYAVFWSFTSQRGAIEQNVSLQAQVAELRAAVETEKATRPENSERAEALNKLMALKTEYAKFETELAAYGTCDPAKVEEKKRAVILAKEAVVRWTDNYLVLLSHFTCQNGVEAAVIRAYLGIDEEYEDLDA
ncbi:meiotic nuclear division protein 1 [Dichomitus squalens]|uniref:Meiotic nuclear division protein 1 n=1 Tax=Dichomitus squalens TaxID=114155 RepID=A0A4Q9MGY8_9APHY|nr:meiotic nuclear division protein 1 [Dichomitus squalens]